MPDRDHGYCVDDNARALMLSAMADDLAMADRLRLGTTYAAFVEGAWNRDSGRFRNFMSYDRQWLEATGSDDSNGRTYWALCVTECQFPDEGISRWAATLIDETAGLLADMHSPRAAAFVVLGSVLLCETRKDCGWATDLVRKYCEFLQFRFKESATPDWRWFETGLSYDNCRLAEALIRGGRLLQDQAMVETGLEALDWIAVMQQVSEGRFRPVGTDGFGQSFEAPAQFDQQPVEAWAAIDAYALAHSIAPETGWRDRAETAYAWFTGRNDCGQPLGDVSSGECFDGLNPAGVNLNRGAKSVLAWQFATRRIAALRVFDAK